MTEPAAQSQGPSRLELGLLVVLCLAVLASSVAGLVGSRPVPRRADLLEAAAARYEAFWAEFVNGQGFSVGIKVSGEIQRVQCDHLNILGSDPIGKRTVRNVERCLAVVGHDRRRVRRPGR